MFLQHVSFIIPLLLALSNHSHLNNENNNQPCIRVCTSPACIADGSYRTLEKLQALSPYDVKDGTCQSLCGNGPIVTLDDGKKLRRMKDNRLDDLVRELQPKYSEVLLEAYECIVAGDQAFVAKDWDHAIRLYERAFHTAYSTVLQLQASSSRTDTDRILQCWIRARRNQASSHLELGQMETALLTAQGACNLSRNQDDKCFAVLAQAYRALDQPRNEKDAIQRMLSLMSREATDSTQQSNERRTWQFRLDKLERDLSRPPQTKSS